jgi:predicted enzyme related to lactoylglutathione lyase
MATKQTKSVSKKTPAKKAAEVPASIVWFEVPADDVARARKFYKNLFGWNMDKFPMPFEYWHIDTGGADASPDGAIMARQNPGQRGITNYIMVPSVDKAVKKIEKLGGVICMPKTAVANMGYFSIAQDTEGNMFAVWERDENAK